VNRRIAILIIVVNLLATAAGLWALRHQLRNAGPWNAAEVKQGLAAYLASATTPSEMQARSVEVAEMMDAAWTVKEAARVLVYRYLRNIVLLGGFNVVAVGIGLWVGRSSVRAEAAIGQ